VPDDPSWLARLRDNAKQRPRTQFVKIRWHDLQQLLQQRDLLMHAADPATRKAAEQLGSNEYGRSKD
jgi:hypothetical protein